MKSFLGKKHLPRGLRNNNLGNLIITPITWVGKVPESKNTDGHFEQFISIPYGIRAMYKDIISDFKKGKNTLTSLINEYAPALENNTTAYIKSVSKKTGIPANKKLTTLPKGVLIEIAKAMVMVENFGGEYKKHASLIDHSDYDEAYSLLEAITEKKKVIQ